VVLLAVTGWRKMSVVSFDDTISSPQDFLDTTLPYAPKGSPAVPLFRSLLGKKAGRVEFEPYAPKQLALLLTQHKLRSALLPEPLVSTVLGKIPGLKLAFSLEDAYAERNHGRARIPWAGLAAHERIVREYPDRLRALFAGMRRAAEELQGHPDEAAAVLPPEFADAVASDVFRASLARDRILVEEAAAVQDEVRAYLELTAPDIFASDSSWFGRDFLWSSDLRD
jgi:NitT/TauT family transport system substrate-binding protein